MRVSVLFFLLALVNARCAPVLSDRAAPETAAPGTILFADDFSEPGGWGLAKQVGAGAEYFQGWLRIRVNAAQVDTWSVAGLNLSDVQVEVDAARLGGPENNVYGALCRYVDKEHFYMLVISSDGYYGIAKMKGGQYSMIGADQLQYSSAIAGGVAPNHLRADCAGEKLSLFVNGHKLMEAQDADFTSGDVGLLAGAYEVEGVDILFDNFVVKKP
jgi:hypothetical protein